MHDCDNTFLLGPTNCCTGTAIGLLSLQTEVWKWPRDASIALQRYVNVSVENQLLLKEAACFIAKQLTSNLHSRYKSRINRRIGKAQRTVKIVCTPTVFKKLFWANLLPNEKIQKPSRKRSTYRAKLYSLRRMVSFVGWQHLALQTQQQCKVLVAPKAYCLEDTNDTSLATPAMPALCLHRGDYVAVLMELEDLCYCWQPQMGEVYVDILGQQVRGSLGLCKQSLLKFVSPTTIYYSPTSMLLILISPFHFMVCMQTWLIKL